MDNIIITVTIVVGAIACSMSLGCFIGLLIRKHILEIKERGLGIRTSATSGIPISEKELEEVYGKIRGKYVSGIYGAKSKGSVREGELDLSRVGVNADTLSQLRFLRWMKANMMINTVTDLLGLDLSKMEKQYAYGMITANMERCKNVLPPKSRESIEGTFKKVLEQLGI